MGLKLGIPFNDDYPICGSLRMIYQLKPEGFQVQMIGASNSVMLDFCISKKQIDQTELKSLAAFAEAEEMLHENIEFSSNQNLYVALRARVVLDEAVRLRRQSACKISHLTQVLENTADMMKSEAGAATIGAYVNFSNKLHGMFSWAKALSGAMLSLTGALVIAGSVMTAIATFGLSSPISVIGLKVGVSLMAEGLSLSAGILGMTMAGSGLSLMCMGRRKSLSKKAHSFSKAMRFFNFTKVRTIDAAERIGAGVEGGDLVSKVKENPHL